MLSAPSRTSGHGYAVVDLEATGSSSRRHRVVELAVVLLDRDLGPEGEFSTLVDPQGPVGPTHIHGIDGGDLGGAPLFAGIAARLLTLLRGRVLVGHNVGCDRAFLVAEYARVGVLLPVVPELCTMRMAVTHRAQRALGAPREGDEAPGVRHGLSLVDCAFALGVTDWDAHTALGDARATARIFAHYAQDPGTALSAGLDVRLALAAAVQWPEHTGLLAPPDALWKRRTNDSARRMVPNVLNGSA